MTDFLDTNILVYAYDDHEPDKQQVSRRIIEQAFLSGEGALSAQVLSEFFVAVSGHLPSPFLRIRILALSRGMP